MNYENGLESSDYGQFVVIHPDMYEYKREVDNHIVRQRIGQDLIDEKGDVIRLQPNGQYPIIYPPSKSNFDHPLINPTGRYFIICTFHVISYIYNKIFAR